MKKVLAALLAVLALAGCDEMNKGKVIDHRYTASFMYFMPVTTGKTTVLIPETMPEQWELELKDGDNYGWRHVSPQEYGKYENGSMYP